MAIDPGCILLSALEHRSDSDSEFNQEELSNSLLMSSRTSWPRPVISSV